MTKRWRVCARVPPATVFSMEEEARRILKEAVSAPERLGDLALRIFGPHYGVDLELPEHVPHAPMDLSE